MEEINQPLNQTEGIEQPASQNLDSLVEKVIQESPPVKPEKKGIPKSILLVIVLIIVGGLLFYAITYLDLLGQLGLSTTQEEEIEQQGEDEFTLYQGDTVSAQVPSGWSIVEYYDGDGIESPPTAISFAGLTGLKIFKGNTEIFYLEAITGIGWHGYYTYARFQDENPEYYAQIVEDAGDMLVLPEIMDYTDSEYAQFTWLDKTFRRIEKDYTYDTVPDNEYFEPRCDQPPGIISFEGLEHSDDHSTSIYLYGPTEDATLDDLLIVDGILNSMTLSS